MEEREIPLMHKYGENKTTRILMATVRHVIAWSGRKKYQAAWFLLKRVHESYYIFLTWSVKEETGQNKEIYLHL